MKPSPSNQGKVSGKSCAQWWGQPCAQGESIPADIRSQGTSRSPVSQLKRVGHVRLWSLRGGLGPSGSDFSAEKYATPNRTCPRATLSYQKKKRLAMRSKKLAKPANRKLRSVGASASRETSLSSSTSAPPRGESPTDTSRRSLP